MREQPGLTELIDAVSEFITRDLAPTLTGRLAFHARVAANVLAIVKREVEQGPAADLADAHRLAALLGGEGDPATQTEELCRRIEAGEIAADDPALIEHLWATTLATLAVDQPGYATYRRIVAAENTPKAERGDA
ncbi:MAG TPA: DUF6285 domain-containing protein [Caulobacteraceae bacterium]|nr:DUF6285 domain-containing protein [Caulobacteraceae bacterium]